MCRRCNFPSVREKWSLRESDIRLKLRRAETTWRSLIAALEKYKRGKRKIVRNQRGGLKSGAIRGIRQLIREIPQLGARQASGLARE